MVQEIKKVNAALESHLTSPLCQELRPFYYEEKVNSLWFPMITSAHLLDCYPPTWDGTGD